VALLAADILPTNPGNVPRYLAFCYVNDSRDRFMANNHL
jgi:hypothetical protein